MIYLLAILLPPVALLCVGKPFQALLNLLLWLFFILPGIAHALFVLHQHYADKRFDRLGQKFERRSANSTGEIR